MTSHPQGARLMIMFMMELFQHIFLIVKIPLEPRQVVCFHEISYPHLGDIFIFGFKFISPFTFQYYWIRIVHKPLLSVALLIP